ncbi:MAG: hypothetical protein CL946_08320 [Ectothiorhodospiraceae bacterium]|nr:hypothetical protein [Ectothiorhodospiraceae bacterium]
MKQLELLMMLLLKENLPLIILGQLILVIRCSQRASIPMHIILLVKVLKEDQFLTNLYQNSVGENSLVLH